jgi:purine nucleoside phosphorylase
MFVLFDRGDEINYHKFRPMKEGRMTEKILGVIGGSGLYEMEGLEEVREVSLTTPFGEAAYNIS